MPTPVIADVYRLAHICQSETDANFTVFTRHYSAPGKTDAELAAAYIDHFSGDQVLLLSDGWKFEQMGITPLDGVSPEQIFTFTGGAQGGSSGQIVPGYCGVVSQRTAQKGARGRGRMYIGPTTEGALTSGKFLTTDATTVVDAWVAFDALMVADGFQPGIASYVHHDFHAITTMRADIPAGIQRRRQRRLVG